MRRRICTVGPTDVYLHLGTLLFVVYALLTGCWPSLLASFLSILLHECAHALAAAILGQPPREMELTPLGAVLRLEDEERLPPLRRLLMLAAGPAMTLLLCLLALRMTAWGWLPVAVGRRLFTANLAILAVNLLPALPLDGGRILTLLLACLLRPETVRRIVRALGTLLGLAAIGGSLWLSWRFGGWNWSLAAAGCFLLYSASTATTTLALHELRRLMDRKIALESRGHASVHRMAILADQPLHRAVRLLHPRALTEFAVTERATLRPMGILTEERLIARYLEQPDMTCLAALPDQVRTPKNAQNTAKSAQKA